MRTCLRKHTPLFMPLMCSCSSNIESVVLTKYSELIACLLVAKQINELLLKNHQSHHTGSINKHGRGRGRGRGYYGQGRGHGHGRYNSWNRGKYNQSQDKNNTSNNQKLNLSEKLYGKATGPHKKKVYEIECYRCGMKGH